MAAPAATAAGVLVTVKMVVAVVVALAEVRTVGRTADAEATMDADGHRRRHSTVENLVVMARVEAMVATEGMEGGHQAALVEDWAALVEKQVALVEERVLRRS